MKLNQVQMSNLLKYYDKSVGRFFHLKFYKRDGSIREMQCRFGVTCALKGGQASYDPDEKGCIVVYVEAKGYRSVRFRSIISATIDKQVFEMLEPTYV